MLSDQNYGVQIKDRMRALPSPGTKQLQIRQNQARQIGRTGMAAFIIEVCSTSDMSSFGRVSSGGSVGAMLCFLLTMLGRRLGSGSFFRRQHSSVEHKREQQPLYMEWKTEYEDGKENIYILEWNTVILGEQVWY